MNDKNDKNDKNGKPVPAFQPLQQLSSPGEELVRQGKTVAKVDTGLFQAVQALGPRDIQQFEKNVIYEAAKAGVAVLYQWKQGGSTIKGGSIKLANILLRNFGKCTVITEIDGENSREWRLSSTFVDYENGILVNRLFTQRKNPKIGGHDDDRKLDIAFQIGQSKAIRNIVLNMMPPHVVDAAIEAGENQALGSIRKMGLKAAIKKSTDFLAQQGISEAQIIAKHGKSLAEFSDRDVLALWADCVAIKEHHETAQGIYSGIEDRGKAEVEKVEEETPKPSSKTKQSTTSKEKPGLFDRARQGETEKASKPSSPKEKIDDPDMLLAALMDSLGADAVGAWLGENIPPWDKLTGPEKIKALDQCYLALTAEEMEEEEEEEGDNEDNQAGS